MLAKFRLLLWLLLPVAICQLSMGTISATSTTILTSSSYTFTFYRFSSVAVPLNASLVLTFATDYQTRIASPSCSSGDFGTNNISCSFLGTQLTISGLFSQNEYLNLNNFKITVGGITNPSPAKAYSPVLQLQLLSSGGVVEQGTSSQALTITPLSAACSTVLSNELVFARGQVKISYVSTYIIGASNSSYSLNIQMDNYYSLDSTQTSINPAFTPEVTAFQPLGTASLYTLEYVTAVTVTMLMPPSTQNMGNFITVSSYDKNNLGEIDSCSISLTGIQPNVLNQLTVSPAKVQTTSALQFSMKLSTPLMNTDQVRVLFPSLFGLAGVTSTAITVNTFTFGLNKMGQELVLTAALSSPLLKDNQLSFTVQNITLPFTTAPSVLTVSVLSYDGYYRINQTYQYSCLAGSLSVAVTCLSYQLGISTTCLFSITTASALSSSAAVKMAFPNDFPITTSANTCQISGTNLMASATCSYSSISNSITASNFNASVSNIAPLLFTLNVSLVMSRNIGQFAIALSTLSAGEVVDSGTVSITASQRTLSNSQFGVTSSASSTFSPTVYSLGLNLPFDLGYTYTVEVFLPVEVQSGLSVTISTGALVSYSNYTIVLSSLLPSGTTIGVSNLLTPTSQAPSVMTISISYNGQVMFSGSSTVTMSVLKSFSTYSISQSNQVVYSSYTATIRMSGLSVGDILRLDSPESTYFYSTNQNVCSTSVVQCNSQTDIRVLAVDNEAVGVTVFSVGLVNLARVGSLTLTATSYDALGIYGKRTGNYSLTTTTPNNVQVTGSSPPPYLLEQSSYSFQLVFTTPNATQLLLGSNGFTSVSVVCQHNCNFLATLSSGTLLSLSSTSARVAVTATNPSSFTSSTVFGFTTMDGAGNTKDYGEYQPVLSCSLPCRSCQSSNDSYCLSCYSWKIEKHLYLGTCLETCPTATFPYLSGTQWTCLPCATACSVCSATGCTACASGYFIYSGSCFQSCPDGSLTVSSNFSCSVCLSPCAACITTTSTCTLCQNNYYLLNYTCYSTCPDGYYVPSVGTSCQLCNPVCLTCNAAGCLSCQPSDYLYRGSCFGACPAGSFPEVSSCTTCLASCSACSSLLVCSSCSSGYYLAPNSTCNSICPSGYYPSNSLCLVCAASCLTCNISGCLSCSNSSLYLQGQQCVSVCASPQHPNNQTMRCEVCISPCSGCTWSDACLSCISGYSLLGTACLSVCPSGYYSEGTACRTCPSLCGSCSWVNQQVACSSCINGSLIYSYDCVSECPNTTILSGMYCLSSDCSSLDNCMVCSGFRCLQCLNLYEITSDYSCQKKPNDSAVLQALAQIPVPFPFLIAIVMLIVVAFLLKYHFQKMSAPLFLYALAGVPEQLSLIIWATLAMLWNANVLEPLAFPSSPHATVLIVIVYFLLNVLQLILWRSRIVPDRQHRLWERQDNRCSSNALAFFSLLLSYRLDVLRFSRTGHSPKLSARLSSGSVFLHYSVLAVFGVFVNAGSVVVSVYLSSIQGEHNYLFFCCLEVAIIGVLMVVLAIVMLCIPKEQLLEDKAEYKYGQDEEQLEGPSLQEALGVEEEYHSQGEVHSGSAMAAKEAPSSDISSAQPEELISLEEGAEFGFTEEEGAMVGNKMTMHRTAQKGIATKSGLIEEEESQEVGSDSHILVDQMEANRVDVIALADQFKLRESQGAPLFSRQPGTINKQLLHDLPQQGSEGSSQYGQFQQYTLDNSNRQWRKTTLPRTQEQEGLIAESAEPDRGIIDARAAIENDIVEEERRREQQAVEEREKRLQEERRREKLVQKQNEKRIREERRRDQMAEEEREKRRRQQERRERERREWQQQQENERMEAARAEIEKIVRLNQLLGVIDQQEQQLTELNLHLEIEEQLLHIKQQERLRQKRERVLMSIEEQLSQASPLFQSIQAKNKQTRPHRIRRDSQESPGVCTVGLRYSINEEENLAGEMSPTKIKIVPKPLLSQYKRQHIFQEEKIEIDQEEEEQPEIVFEGSQSYIVPEKAVDKPKSILRKQSPTRKQPSKKELPVAREKKKSVAREKKEGSVAGEKEEEEELGEPLISVEFQQCQGDYNSEEGKQGDLSPVVPLEEIHQQINQTENIELPEPEEGQPLCWGQEQHFVSAYEDRSIRSDQSHWPIEPELEERILSVEKRADQYLAAPKQPFLYLQPSQDNYEEESEQTVGEIVFEESEKMMPVEELMRVETRKKIRQGRVNRRVIDLAP